MICFLNMQITNLTIANYFVPICRNSDSLLSVSKDGAKLYTSRSSFQIIGPESGGQREFYGFCKSEFYKWTMDKVVDKPIDGR